MVANKKQIEDAILEVAGNPVSGPIRALAGQMAQAILDLEVKLDEPVSARKEKRVIAPSETRGQADLTE